MYIAVVNDDYAVSGTAVYIMIVTVVVVVVVDHLQTVLTHTFNEI